jgi:hypothetical protein
MHRGNHGFVAFVRMFAAARPIAQLGIPDVGERLPSVVTMLWKSDVVAPYQLSIASMGPSEMTTW